MCACLQCWVYFKLTLLLQRSVAIDGTYKKFEMSNATGDPYDYSGAAEALWAYPTGPKTEKAIR